MSTSDANRVALRYVGESGFGVPPANPPYQTLRYKSENLAQKTNTDTSKEIRSDRKVSDLILLGYDVSGGFTGEMSYGTFDDWFAGSFLSPWVATPVQVNTSAGTPISALGTATVTVASGGTAFKTGHLLRTSGFVLAANNKVVPVLSSTGTTITVAAATYSADASPQTGARIKVVGFQGVAGDIDALLSGSVKTWTSTTIDFTTLGLAVGMWVKAGGSAGITQFAVTPANNGWYRISAIAAHILTFDVVPTGFATSAETTSTLSVFIGDYVRDGVTETYFTCELEYASQPVENFQYFNGCEVSKLTFTATAQSILELAFEIMGKQSAIGTTRTAGATTLPSTLTQIMNTSSHMVNVREGGTTVGTPSFVMDLTLSIDNKLRQQKAVGTPYNIGLGLGQAFITGSLNTYFGDASFLNKLFLNTQSSLDFRMIDGTGQEGYVFDMPLTKYASGEPNVTGIDTDVMLPMNFQALVNTNGYQLHLQRFEYVESP